MAYIFAALVKGNLLCGEYNYRTFHAAVQEKFPDFHINKGYDWAEALCNAVLSDDLNYNINISEDQVKRGRRYATDIKLRLLSLVNPNFV